MKLSTKSIALLAKVIISVLICWYVGAKVDWRAFFEAFSSVHVGWLAASTIILGLCSVVGAWRWQILLRVQGLELSFWRVLSVTFIGIFFNAFLLGSSGGDAMRIYMVAQDAGSRKVQAAWSVLIDRLMGIVALFVAALGILGLAVDKQNATLERLATLSSVSLGLCALGALAFFLTPETLLARFFPRLMDEGNQSFVASSLRAVLIHRKHPRPLSYSFLLSLLIVVLLVATGAALARALNIEASLSALSVTIPLVLVIISIPLSFSGFGVREGAFAFFFGTFGIGGADSLHKAVLYSLFWFFISLLTSAVGGLFFLATPTKTEAAS